MEALALNAMNHRFVKILWFHGSGVWSQLCLASHQMITPPTTMRTMKIKMTKPQMSVRLLFWRSRSSQLSGCLLIG